MKLPFTVDNVRLQQLQAATRNGDLPTTGVWQFVRGHVNHYAEQTRLLFQIPHTFTLFVPSPEPHQPLVFPDGSKPNPAPPVTAAKIDLVYVVEIIPDEVAQYNPAMALADPQLLRFSLDAIFPRLAEDLSTYAGAVGLPEVNLSEPPVGYLDVRDSQGAVVPIPQEYEGDETPLGRSAADWEFAYRWQQTLAEIQEIILRVNKIGQIDLYAWKGDFTKDAAFAEGLDSLPSIWAALQTACAHLHSFGTLVATTRPFEEGPCFALLRSSIEVAATVHWLLWPESSMERVKRFLKWKHQNALDEYNAMQTLYSPEGDGEKSAALQDAENDYETEKSDLVELAQRLYADHGTWATKQVSSKKIIASVDLENTSWSLEYAWQFASAHAHGRPWASRQFGVIPLGNGPSQLMPITSIKARTYTYSPAVVQLCAQTVELFKRRVGLAA